MFANDQMFLFLFSILFIHFHDVQSQYTRLFEGDSCGVKNGLTFKCKKIQECQSAFEMLRGNERPRICSYDGFIPIVCCKPEVNTTTAEPSVTTAIPLVEETTTQLPVSDNKPKPTNGRKRVSQRKCEEYKEHVYQPRMVEALSIGWADDDDEEEEPNRTKRDIKGKERVCGIDVQPLIVGGEKAKPQEFPHQVNIGYLYGRRKLWLCGGSLISENFVLSAAHCSTTRFGPPKLAVIGDLDIGTETDNAKPVELKIVQIIKFPKYQHGNPYYDIALFRLENNVTFDGYKRPACLNADRNIPVKDAIASGWGYTSANRTTDDHLLKVSIDIIPNNVCRRYWAQGGALKRGIDDEQMICAGDLNGPKDTCQGDSGGPLQYVLKDNSCMYSLIGVTGFGRSCGIKVPGVYARISYYVPWIESIVWPNEL